MCRLMEILENKALVFTTRKAAQITAFIPRSKVLATRGDKARMMVFWGDAEVRILRNLKLAEELGAQTGVTDGQA